MSVYGKNHYNIVKYQPPTNKNKWGKKLDPKLRVWGTGLGDCDWKIADYYAAPNAKIFL